MKGKSNQTNVVLPGDVLGVIEEFLPGNGVYEDEEGQLHSQVVGIPIFDLMEHVVSIKSLTAPSPTPNIGDTVLARIIDVKSTFATAKIFRIEGRESKNINLFTGILHISKVSTSFIRSMYSVVRIGDIIRARVLNSVSPYLLSIRGKDYGVTLAFCSQCLGPLVPRDLELYCPRCRRSEKRKIAFKYYIRLRV